MNSTVTSSLPLLNPLLDAGNSLVLLLRSYWSTYYSWMDNDFLATGLLFLVIHELVYFGKSAPWAILDHIPFFRRYKIQETKIPTNSEQLECLKDVLIAHAFVEALPIFAFQPICNIFAIDYTADTFPELKPFLLQIMAFFFMEDTWHYWFHRALHYGPLYKYIHKQHHKYAAPFGLTAEYAHPIEVAVTGLGTVGSPLLWAYFFGNVHLITVICWVVLRLFQAVDSHSGYDFPWSLRHFLPIWAGADHHDDHHKYFVGNYASSFRHWDFLLGTETPATAKRHTILKSSQNVKKTK
jgi:methylsterol monooxygenase